MLPKQRHPAFPGRTHQIRDHFLYGLSESVPAPGLGKAIDLYIALVILRLIGLLCQHHFFYRATSIGILRGGLITAIYSRSLRLTTRT